MEKAPEEWRAKVRWRCLETPKESRRLVTKGRLEMAPEEWGGEGAVALP